MDGVSAEGWRFVAFVRLVPLFPFNLVNYAFGLTRIRVGEYVLASFVCMAPGALAYTYLGYAGREATSTKATWRARFSLNVEPAGPVHALVSLSGDKTSVRMWAERPATAAQLRAGAAQLSQALSKAELTPGDIVIRDGVPPQPVPARAGHFLDRAL